MRHHIIEMTAIIITTINKMGLGQQSHFVSNVVVEELMIISLHNGGRGITVPLLPVKLSTQMEGGDNILITCETFKIMLLLCVCFWRGGDNVLSTCETLNTDGRE